MSDHASSETSDDNAEFIIQEEVFLVLWESFITAVNLAGMRLLDLSDNKNDVADAVYLQVQMMDRVSRSAQEFASIPVARDIVNEVHGYHRELASTSELRVVEMLLREVPRMVERISGWAEMRGAKTELREAFAVVRRAAELMRDCVSGTLEN